MAQTFLSGKGKNIMPALKLIGQIIMVIGCFLSLYFFLILGFSLGFKM